MNLQFVLGVYLMVKCLTYSCKPEHKSEFMKKASKKILKKMYSFGNIFFTNREVCIHVAIKKILSLLMRYLNKDILYFSTGRKSISISERCILMIQMYLHLILLTNTKVNHITYIQFAEQALHPVMLAKRQLMCQQSQRNHIATLFQ